MHCKRCMYRFAFENIVLMEHLMVCILFIVSDTAVLATMYFICYASTHPGLPITGGGKGKASWVPAAKGAHMI